MTTGAMGATAPAVRVFIGHSGERGRLIAVHIHDWLSRVIGTLKRDHIYCSDWNPKSALWREEVYRELRTCTLGLFCLTPESQSAPWPHFEAGALWARREGGSVSGVYALLFDFGASVELQGPLGSFQHTVFNRDDFWKLTTDINRECERAGNGVNEHNLRVSFDAVWTTLEPNIQAILAQGAEAKRVTLEDLALRLDGIVDILRSPETPLRQDRLDGGRPSGASLPGLDQLPPEIWWGLSEAGRAVSDIRAGLRNTGKAPDKGSVERLVEAVATPVDYLLARKPPPDFPEAEDAPEGVAESEVAAAADNDSAGDPGAGPSSL